MQKESKFEKKSRQWRGERRKILEGMLRNGEIPMAGRISVVKTAAAIARREAEAKDPKVMARQRLMGHESALRSHSNRAKPLSLWPMGFEEAVRVLVTTSKQVIEKKKSLEEESKQVVAVKRAKFLREVKKVCGAEACTRIRCKDCREIFSERCRMATGFTWR